MADSTRYDLEERTLKFATNVRVLIRSLSSSVLNQEDRVQLLRASSAVGANYIEANEALGKKDFQMRIRICLKEAKECTFWLRLLETSSKKHLEQLHTQLLDEARQFIRIFSKIIHSMRQKEKTAAAVI